MVEIERKFLVPEPPGLSDTAAEAIEQGYLSLGEDGEVRLRRRAGTALLTVKRGAGMIREEAEIELDPGQFDALWPLTAGRRVLKLRHLLPHQGLTIELDVYKGELAGLAVAEVEFTGEGAARAFQPPDWFGAEVTGDPAYLNSSLALRGRPS